MRFLALAAGAVAGLALLVPVAWLTWPHHAVACVPYQLIPHERICGQNVYWDNPDGETVVIGRTVDLAPMPQPRVFRR